MYAIYVFKILYNTIMTNAKPKVKETKIEES